MIDLVGVTSLVASVFGYSAKDLLPKVSRYLTSSRVKSLGEKRDTVRHHMLLDALDNYYDFSGASRGRFCNYLVSMGNGSQIPTSIVVKPEWVGIDIDLTHIRYSLTGNAGSQVGSPPASEPLRLATRKEWGLEIWKPRVSEDRIAQYTALFYLAKSKVWNSNIYRLVEVKGLPSNPQVCFSLDSFLNYRLQVGLLMEELTLALMENNFDSKKAMEGKDEFLPLRNHFLGTPARFDDFQSRVCAGGVQVTLAIARTEGEFLIPIQVRSQLVGEGQGLLSVVPMAFHQPMIDPECEMPLGSSVFRELFEELFEGKEIEQDVKRLEPKWYFSQSAPLGWLRDHQDSYTLKCTCFTVNLLAGTYDFGILLAIRDPEFWSRFGSGAKPNWEAAKINTLSSRHIGGLSTLIASSPWASQGLVSLVEGLSQLKALYPDEVSDLGFSRNLVPW